MATLRDRVVNFGMQALDDLTVEHHVEDGLAKALVKTNQNALVLALEESDRHFEESMRRMDKAFDESNRRIDKVDQRFDKVYQSFKQSNADIANINASVAVLHNEKKYVNLKFAAMFVTGVGALAGWVVLIAKLVEVVPKLFS